MRFFQKFEAIRYLKLLFLFQEVNSTPFIYFFLRIWLQILFPKIPLQQDLAANDIANQLRFIIPHPPISLGDAMDYHLARWKSVFFFAPLHNFFSISCWIFCIIEEGTSSKLNQYIGIPWRTALTKTILSPSESHRKVQFFILLTIFSISHFQSVIL